MLDNVPKFYSFWVFDAELEQQAFCVMRTYTT